MPIDSTNADALRSRALGRHALPRWIVIWFWLDAVVALAPPFYWVANGATRAILGVPLALVYFLAVGLCISSSVVVAYLMGTGDAR